MSQINPTILQKSLDEENLEASLVKPLLEQSNDFKNSLLSSQERLLQRCKQLRIPIRFFVFTLSDSQKQTLLEHAFITLFAEIDEKEGSQIQFVLYKML